MTARIQCSGCVIEVQAETVKSLFKLIAEVQEIMAPRECEYCHEKTRLHYRVRKAQDKFDYYELHCDNCAADFQFGQLQDGSGLFPKGWHKYERDAGFGA